VRGHHGHAWENGGEGTEVQVVCNLQVEISRPLCLSSGYVTG